MDEDVHVDSEPESESGSESGNESQKGMQTKEKKTQKEKETISKLPTLLKGYVNNSDMSDLKFVVGKEKKVFYAHSLILSNSSTYWCNELKNKESPKNSKGSQIIKLKETNKKVFKCFLEYIYTREINVAEDVIYSLYELAKDYNLNCLEGLLEHQFELLLTNDNALRHYCNTFKQVFSKWHAITLRYLESNSKELLKDKTCFIGYDFHTVYEILSLPSLRVPEILLFRSLLRWGKNEMTKQSFTVPLKRIIDELLPLIRLQLLSFEQLEEVSKTSLVDPKILLDHTLALAKSEQLKSVVFTRAGPRPNDLKVLILGWARGGIERMDDLKRSFQYGEIHQVEIMDIRNEIPELSTLKLYDVIVLRSANIDELIFSIELGNRLADFVDTGRGLIVFSINALTNNENCQIKGRIVTDNYIPLGIGERATINLGQMGNFDDPNHQILKNVTTFKTKEYAHIVDRHINGGNLIASWISGEPFITEKRRSTDSGIVVVFNTHSTSTRVTNECGKAWLKETDGDKLFSNAAIYVGLDRFK
ncbi:pep-cterm sorting domain-containing protein [Anaeramoeba flamelloides]|uniref:Pep-cterm sorting domain-containing protein n=1 Tax=Anaeramoeba flamelloides TaxID=1746091 RepID=A0ABQ8Z5S5_9EUKA|nr:pep-cterm sorting domain-containing protein [Anaeramoeba flamelloides]